MWWQPSECPEDPARSNWKAAFISLIELQVLRLGRYQIAASTDTWLWQSAPCQVAYPSVFVATQELSESVLLAVSIAPKGILLLSQWHCIRILPYSLSPATCHPVQRRPNMRVVDCSTVWVCKCLQLMYLSALHLTLFDIYSTTVHSNTKNVSVKRVCLSAMAIYEGLEFLSRLWFAPKHHKW